MRRKISNIVFIKLKLKFFIKYNKICMIEKMISKKKVVEILFDQFLLLWKLFKKFELTVKFRISYTDM